MVRKHYLVSGKVQGVGFRNFVMNQAQALQLTGAVRNLEDGRVEILAAGLEGAIADFERAVKTGPTHAHVNSVEQKKLSEKINREAQALLEKAKGFTVESDGEAAWT
jgi:acylphosphatase